MIISKEIQQYFLESDKAKDFSILAAIELKDGRKFDNVILENYSYRKKILQGTKEFFENNEDPFGGEIDNNFNIDDFKLFPSSILKIKESPNFIKSYIYRLLGDFTVETSYDDSQRSFYFFVIKMNDGEFYNFMIEEIMDFGNFLSFPKNYDNSNISDIYRNSYYNKGKINKFQSLEEIESLGIQVFRKAGYQTFYIDIENFLS